MTPTIHPNTPRKLAAKFRKHKYHYHPLADELGVNVAYIFALIKHGIEPKGVDVRRKLFLSRIPKHKPKAEPKPLQDYEKWWRAQGKTGQANIKRQTYELNKEQMP